MKKFLTIAFAGAIGIFSSCNNNTAGGSQGEKNIAIVHSINDAIESGDVNKLDQYIATDAVDHAGEHGDINGLDSIKANLKRFHDEYPGMKLEEQQEAANSDYVFYLQRFTGTNVVPSMGAPAGTHFDMSAVHVVKFKDGKASEHWEYMTMADMMKMTGGSNMGMGNMESTKMDTTKH